MKTETTNVESWQPSGQVSPELKNIQWTSPKSVLTSIIILIVAAGLVAAFFVLRSRPQSSTGTTNTPYSEGSSDPQGQNTSPPYGNPSAEDQQSNRDALQNNPLSTGNSWLYANNPTGTSGATNNTQPNTSNGGSSSGTPGVSPDEPPAPHIRPTRQNTGPRYALTEMTTNEFFSTRTCNRQRIVGNLNFDAAWMKGQTYNLTDCEITGNLYIYIVGGGATLPLEEMPVINMDYVDVLGSIVALNAVKLTANHSYFTGGQLGLKDVWAPFVTAPAPYVFSNSMFYGYYASQPDHTEALHLGDYGTGYRFTNVSFVQQGGSLENSGVTSTINFHGNDTIFDGCWFIWDGEVPAYYTVYIDGTNVVVKNSYFQKGAGNYVYPDSTTQATYINNRDFDTNQLLSL